jgi:hypothetical protein
MCTWSLMKSDWVSDMYSLQDVRNACPCTLSLSKLLGAPVLTLEGCDAFREVVAGGGEAGGGGVRCSLASRVLYAASSLLSVSLVTQVASALSLSHFSMFWSHLASVENELMTSMTCYGSGAGGVGQGVVGGNQSPLLCNAWWHLYYCPTLTSALGESILL